MIAIAAQQSYTYSANAILTAFILGVHRSSVGTTPIAAQGGKLLVRDMKDGSEFMFDARTLLAMLEQVLRLPAVTVPNPGLRRLGMGTI